MENKSQHYCEVCYDTIAPPKGIAACMACRKFFRRNYEKLSELPCTTGLERCNLEPQTAEYCRRNCCPKCRMTKCLEIGMAPLQDYRRKGVELIKSSVNQSNLSNSDCESSRAYEPKKKGMKPRFFRNCQ